MDPSNIPNCSHDPVPSIEVTKSQETNDSNMSKEIVTHMYEEPRASVEAPKSFTLKSFYNAQENEQSAHSSAIPLMVIRPSVQSPIPNQPRFSSLPSPTSVDLSSQQPHSLFFQALAKLNESSQKFQFVNLPLPPHKRQNPDKKCVTGELSPPDSLASAPPSYSFVLRQMAVRRRPRLMGTFIPSPSFVQHTPPPNYTTAFDLYVDNPLPPPPSRVYHFGFTPTPVVCPECGFAGMTVINSKITICTHLCAFLLCIFCCWVCAPLPYILKSCKDVYHYCRNCRNFLGMYCPTNPDSNYP